MFVMGTPAPQGSKKGFARNGRVQMVESSKKVGPWREAVVAECQRAGIAGLVLDGPLRLSAVFYFPRPKSHYRTGRNAHLLRDNAPTHPIGPPDLSKLVRATEDALTQCGAIKDDARIVAFGDLRKEWCDAANPVPGAWVQVHPVAQERPAGWVDPAPRVLPSVMTGQPDVADSFRCACGNAALLNVSHSAAICVGRRGLNLAGLLRQLDERADQQRLGVGVVRLDGQGPASVETWAAVLTLADLVALLRAAGYGTPHARPDTWTDPAPRVLPGLLAEARASVALDRDQTHVVDDIAESFRCACGSPTLPGVAHSAQVCAGPEQDGDAA